MGSKHSSNKGEAIHKQTDNREHTADMEEHSEEDMEIKREEDRDNKQTREAVINEEGTSEATGEDDSKMVAGLF